MIYATDIERTPPGRRRGLCRTTVQQSLVYLAVVAITMITIGGAALAALAQ